MGTNYYLKPPAQSGAVEIHLGKNSMGWAFLFRADEGVKDYPSWLKRIQDAQHEGWTIVNEYGGEVALDVLLGVIQGQREKQSHVDWVQEHHPGYAYGDYWKDVAGHNFLDVEFS